MTQSMELNLLSGMPIPVCDSFHVRQIKLHELSSPSICGLDRYHQQLSIVSMGRDDILKCLQIEEQFRQLPDKEQDLFTPFRLLMEVPTLRQCLYEALSFFILEPLHLVEDGLYFQVTGEDASELGVISEETYPNVRNAIMKVNCLAVEDIEPQKFKGKRGRAIYERIMAGRAVAQKRKEKAGDNDSLTIPCIVSAISARHNSLNLLNIWDLTIYQLYDQFAQLNKNFQVDVSSLKWAAWGSEQFDFSLWYKSTRDTN